MTTELKRHLFTISDYHRMIEIGVLNKNSPVELINGEIIDIPPISDHQAGAVSRIDNILNVKFAYKATISLQHPIITSNTSQPQPDITILKLHYDYYFNAHPKPADVLLLIEVAESSNHYDRTIKIPLYAQAGISEAWLIDLNQNLIEIYRDPLNGVYQQVLILQKGEQLSAMAFPNITFTVDELIG